jgi:hypothetical protein
MKKQFLVETDLSANALITESSNDGKTLYLVGRIMAGDEKNLNGRIYPKEQLSRAVDLINDQIKNGYSVMGELNHPPTLSIDLKNVSHLITEAWMEGSNAMGRCKILDTPSGQIVQMLVKGGGRPGVSSRGTGNVGHNGLVEDFSFIAMDIVAQPSGPGCFPEAIRESVENIEGTDLYEMIRRDAHSQQTIAEQLTKFFQSLK